MDRYYPGATRRRLEMAFAIALVSGFLFGCDRKPGDGPSTVTPPPNVRTPDMMGAQPGGGPATPATPGAQGAGAAAPTPEDRVLVDEGPTGQALPIPPGGATNDPRLLDKDREAREEEAETDLRTAEDPAQPEQQAQPMQPMQPMQPPATPPEQALRPGQIHRSPQGQPPTEPQSTPAEEALRPGQIHRPALSQQPAEPSVQAGQQPAAQN